jgi:hypothetical protein
VPWGIQKTGMDGNIQHAEIVPDTSHSTERDPVSDSSESQLLAVREKTVEFVLKHAALMDRGNCWESTSDLTDNAFDWETADSLCGSGRYLMDINARCRP